MAGDLDRWTRAGILVMLVTGILMFSTDVVGCHNNPSFRFKMTCLTVALLFHFTLHRHVLRRDVPSIASKMAGVTLLLLSTGVVACGRMIAFI